MYSTLKNIQTTLPVKSGEDIEVGVEVEVDVEVLELMPLVRIPPGNLKQFRKF